MPVVRQRPIHSWNPVVEKQNWVFSGLWFIPIESLTWWILWRRMSALWFGGIYYKQSTEVDFFSHSCLGLCRLKMRPGLWRLLQGLEALGKVVSQGFEGPQ